MASPTRDSSSARRPNPRARWSALCGALAVVAVPGGVVFARLVKGVRLLDASGSIPFAVVLGVVAIVLARRGREYVQITLGRAGGEGAATMGRALGILGLLIGITAGLALGFYGLLTLFAD